MADKPYNGIIAELSGMKESILAHLKSHAWKPGSLEQKSLADAKVDDLSLELFSMQGRNRVTYLARVKDSSFILSVNTPRDPKSPTARTEAPYRRALQKRLLGANLPTPEIVGNIFTLPKSGYECEIQTFVHGYQVPYAIDFKPEELESLANTIAKMHIACRNWAPDEKLKSHAVTSTKLPQGYIHDDMHRENLIFDADTHCVKAVLDFEHAVYKPFASDLGHTLRVHFTKFQIDKNAERKAILSLDTKSIKTFLDTYSKYRPIEPREIDIMRETLAGNIMKELKYFNKYMANSSLSPQDMENEREQLVAAVRRDFQYQPPTQAKAR